MSLGLLRLARTTLKERARLHVSEPGLLPYLQGLGWEEAEYRRKVEARRLDARILVCVVLERVGHD